MLSINIICVGKLKEAYLRQAIEEYSKRMKPLCKLSIIELPEERVGDNPSDAEIQRTVAAESERILSKVRMSLLNFVSMLPYLPRPGFDRGAPIIAQPASPHAAEVAQNP